MARSYQASRVCICYSKAQPRLLVTTLRPRLFPANREEPPFLAHGLLLRLRNNRSLRRFRYRSRLQTGTFPACGVQANPQSSPYQRMPEECTGRGTERKRLQGNPKSHRHRRGWPCVSRKCRATTSPIRCLAYLTLIRISRDAVPTHQDSNAGRATANQSPQRRDRPASSKPLMRTFARS